MSTRIVFIGPILILIRTLRLSMRNLPWGFDTTILLGDGISKSVTWIQLWRRMTVVQACSESGPGWTSLLDFRANLWAASGQYRAAEIPPYTVAAILRSALTLQHQRDRRIGESNSDSRRKEFYEQRREAVSSRDHGRDYAKDREHGRDSAKDRDRSRDYGKDKDRDRYNGAGRDQRGSETLLRIVEATPGTRWKTTGSAREIRGTRKTVKTLEIDAASLPLIQRGIDQTTVSVLKLMIIIPLYAHFSMLHR
jgi:hypothetical protein